MTSKDRRDGRIQRFRHRGLAATDPGCDRQVRNAAFHDCNTGETPVQHTTTVHLKGDASRTKRLKNHYFFRNPA